MKPWQAILIAYSLILAFCYWGMPFIFDKEWEHQRQVCEHRASQGYPVDCGGFYESQ